MKTKRKTKSNLTGKYCLVLNRCWLPLQLQSWQDAMTVLCKGSAKALNTKEDFTLHTIEDWIKIHNANKYDKHVNTVKLKIPIPEVIVLTKYDKLPRRKVGFSRENLLIRDAFKCAYCLEPLSLSDMTIDHVTPRALGGITSWVNCVSSCSRCNHSKDDNPPTGHWSPKIKPKKPNSHSLMYHLNTKLDKARCVYPEIWDKFLI